MALFQDPPKLHSLPEMVTICPPALRCLVYLWDQICSNCVQIGQSNMVNPLLSSPSHELASAKLARTALKASVAFVNEAEAKKQRKKKKGKLN